MKGTISSSSSRRADPDSDSLRCLLERTVEHVVSSKVADGVVTYTFSGFPIMELARVRIRVLVVVRTRRLDDRLVKCISMAAIQ